MLTAIIALAILAVIFGLALGYAAIRFKVEGDPLVEKIDALLPQTQCGQCTYAGCRPYAEAIAKGEADINQCPPGGETTIIALADLLGRDPKPLNPEHGEEKAKRVAVIDEEICIGCTLCIQACPVDAILGAPKLMHTVIADECTGCDLCVPPCPVDCIDMVEVKPALDEWVWDFPGAPPKYPAAAANRIPKTGTSHPRDAAAHDAAAKKTGTGS
jgi:electron transport complex protein RnfB